MTGDIIVSAQVESYHDDNVVILFSVTGISGVVVTANLFLDQGIGIPKEVQPNIFQPFYQADISVSRKFGGTGTLHFSMYLTFSGLGLTISKRLAEMHGGSMWFKSSEDHGTTFYFTIDVPLTQSPTVTLIPWAPANRLVVVVETSVGLANVLNKRLLYWGFHAVVFNTMNGVEKFLSENNVNLLVISVEFIVKKLAFFAF